MTVREFTATVTMAVRIVAIHLTVQCLGFGRVRGWLAARLPAACPDRPDDAERITLWATRLRRIKRRFPAPLRGNCLSRSLVLWWMLARDGVPTTLRIGARRSDGTFGAHAWLEHQGVPINAGRRVRGNFATFDGDFAHR